MHITKNATVSSYVGRQHINVYITYRSCKYCTYNVVGLSNCKTCEGFTTGGIMYTGPLS